MIQSSQFIIVLVVTQHILSYTRPLSQNLQKADCEFVRRVLMQTLARKSSENREMKILFVTYGGKLLADSVDVVVIEKPRTARRMAHRSTAGEICDTAMQHFKVIH